MANNSLETHEEGIGATWFVLNIETMVWGGRPAKSHLLKPRYGERQSYRILRHKLNVLGVQINPSTWLNVLPVAKAMTKNETFIGKPLKPRA